MPRARRHAGPRPHPQRPHLIPSQTKRVTFLLNAWTDIYPEQRPPNVSWSIRPHGPLYLRRLHASSRRISISSPRFSPTLIRQPAVLLGRRTKWTLAPPTVVNRSPQWKHTHPSGGILQVSWGICSILACPIPLRAGRGGNNCILLWGLSQLS